MTDSMKFGPEWLRNLSSDGTTPNNPPPPKYQLAEHRYGREEMLALFDRQVRAPERLAGLSALFVEKTQTPLALSQMNEEETRMWNRGINSDAVLRLNGKPAPINIPGGGGGGGAPGVGRGGALVGGRGGSVDRGRGRARGQGSYHYTRGLSYEEPGDAMALDPTGKPTYTRSIGRPFDRAQSMAGGERGWGERNGGEVQEWNGSTSPRKEFVRGLDNNWRRPRGTAGEDEEGWRTATASGSTKYVRPSSWREGDKEAGEVGGGGGRWDGSRVHRGWDGDSHRHHMDPDNLPEWAMENPSESGGSFDASGAFHGGVQSEDDEDCGAGGEPAGLERSKSTADTRSKRRSPPEDAKKTSPSPPHHPPPSIAKSQSTPAMAASPAKTQPSHHQQQQHQHLHASQGSVVRMSPSEPAFQIPLQMAVNNGETVNTLAKHQQVSDKVLQQPFALNDPSILSTKFHHPQQHLANNGVGYDPSAAAHYQQQQQQLGGGVVLNGGPNSFAQRFVSPYATSADPRVHRKNDEDMDRLQEDADKFVDKLTADEEEKIHKMAAVKQSLIGQEDWYYRDPQSEVQGPFAAQEMDEWFRAGYFNVNLLIRRGCDERFSQLGDLIKTWGRVPFLPGPTMPPLKNELLPTPPPTPGHAPAMDHATEAAILQQQYQYQQLMQRQMQLGQQAAFQAALGKLSLSDRWAQLSPNEQQQLLMQQMGDPSLYHPQAPKPPLHQQYLPPPTSVKTDSLPPSAGQHPLHQLIQQMGGQPPAHPPHLVAHGQDTSKMDSDPIQSLLRQMNANSAKQPQMDVWGNPLSAPSWLPPVGQMPTAPPPGQLPVSLWDTTLGKTEMKTEQQIIDERMRAEEEQKRAEDAKKKDAEEKRRKQLEEEQKRKEMEKQRLDQERQRQERQLEEARRKAEEEGKRVMEEQKRLEDESRKKEEKKRKEEEKKKREEEKRKKEEEKERKRKMEEDRKREEEEKKRQAVLDEEEAARKRLEEEEQMRRLEQQHQAYRRLERAKAAPWSTQAAQQQPGSSLAEIQRQEKVLKERDIREQQLLMQTMLQQQQQQQQQQAVAAMQAAADGKAQLQLKWADKKPQPPASKVKSLSEIQAEEAKVSERERAERATQQKDGTVPPSAGIWSAAPQSLTWASAAPVAWGSNNTPQTPVGFWDDVIPAPKPAPATRPAPKPKAAAASNHTSGGGNAQPSPKPPAAKTRNKKEEAVVMKLFDNQRGDDFSQWCLATLHNFEAAAHVDIPTFIGFLRDIESPYEVRDYVKMYLGEGKEAQEFARQFLERRSKWRSAQRGAPQHDDLAQPAPAINPSSTDFTEVKGKAKKVKKNKMFKVDNRILGFSVTAATDRINVGDRDYGEGV